MGFACGDDVYVKMRGGKRGGERERGRRDKKKREGKRESIYMKDGVYA
jgi:hypothetical protein